MSKIDKNNFNDIYKFMHEGISSISSISNDLLTFNKNNSVDEILILLKEKLKQLNYFDSFAFYSVKDSIDFIQTHCHPDNAEKLIENDVEHHIENGTFAWVLNNNHPIVVSGPVSKNNQVLFSLSTRRRIHGMFIANAKDQGNISGVVLDMLQLILSITVFSIDNNELTSQLNTRTLNLEHAKQRAEQSSQARSEFLSYMSHEIRTPMNGVLGMMELLKATGLDEKQLHYINTAQSSGSNMLVILNDILDLSKYESGKMSLEEEEFNIINVVEDVESLFSLEMQNRGIELIVDIDPEIPTYLYGGKTRLWQVVMNLLGNAKKFTESGEIYLTLKLNNIENEDVDVGISVKDSGIGIAEKSLGKVFDSFEQAEVNTTRQYGGTGLGLALCKRLVAMMSGEINVKSILGVGSDFFFNVKMKSVPDKKNFSPFVIDDKDKIHVFFASGNNKVYHAIGSVFIRLTIDYKILSSSNEVDVALSNMSSGSTNILIVDDALFDNDYTFEKIKDECKNKEVNLLINCNEKLKGIYAAEADVIPNPFMPNQFYNYLKILLGVDEITKETNEIFQATVLVVDDNNVNQMVARGILENIGCEVSVANNGQDALDVLKENKFDIVFMDINMPVLNGCDATIQFRETEVQNEYTPIIALTANVISKDIRNYYKAGLDDYLSKPFSQDDILEKLQKWVRLEEIEHLAIKEDGTESINMEHFDEVVLNNLKTILGDGFSELVETYIHDSSVLSEAVMNNFDDFEKLIQDVHALKGCSGNMGAMKLFSMCQDFELQSHQNNSTDRDGIDKIMDELKFVHEYLEN